MLVSGGVVKGKVSGCFSNMTQEDEHKQPQVKNEPENDSSQLQHQRQQSMDDLFEQIFNMPPGFPDSGKVPWDLTAQSSGTSSQNSERLFARTVMASGQSLGSSSSADALEGLQFPFMQYMQRQNDNDNVLATNPSETMAGLQLGSVNASAVALLAAAPSLASSQGWRVPYVSAGLQAFPLGIGQSRNPLLAGDDQQMGKRLREEETRPGAVSNTVFFKNFGAGEGSRPTMPASQSLPSVPFQSYDASISHQQAQSQPSAAAPPASSPAPAPARPRVRARRGQATDPHSIAERQRRERIAERMKALQELVPTCNKTDKGAMLDEIIDYVKFLQLQVKVLSMSRIGGAEAVAPLVAEMSSEVSNGLQLGRNASPTDESMALTEQQVARLMEQDTGAAMQYLQSKGMCLMPLSLAATLTGLPPTTQ
eukprot:TRINITY_DN2838_c0_g1_i3.p1 TRINITY_DN2838_c0_g1~~TRINITY_DN2838_c0_g1_i3.p1  ORF type:complete len:424 (-),score=62.66 TRINITY_DN2838_c0_g1_i3:871-2142(-)